MNRNIITDADAKAFSSAKTTSEIPKTFDAEPPAGTGGAQAQAKPKTPTQDDFLTKLLKYVPPEMLGIYLFIAGIVNTNVPKPREHAIWLLILLLVLAALIIPYDLIVLDIARISQIAMSVLGFGVYVFSLGGWFATTTWYHEWYASIALPLFTLLVAFLKLKPLPKDADQ